MRPAWNQSNSSCLARTLDMSGSTDGRAASNELALHSCRHNFPGRHSGRIAFVLRFTRCSALLITRDHE